MSVILGIDNGLDGGIAIVREDGSINTLVLIPVVEEKRPGKNGKQKTVRRYDESAIAEYFRNVKESNAGKLKAYIESAQAFPGQGVVATFSTGYGYGLYRGILTALGIPYEVVRPQAWQKGFSIPAGAGKGGAYNVAARLFPGAHFHTVRGRLLDGLVDAALIAEYGRRKTNGTVA